MEFIGNKMVKNVGLLEKKSTVHRVGENLTHLGLLNYWVF